MPSYETLVREHHAFVYRVAFGVLHDSAAAEDVAQDVFVEILGRPAAIERAENLRAYLGRAAVNRALTMRRGEQRRARRELAVSTAEAAMDPVEEVFRRELRAKVEELPEEERRAVDLHYFQGCTLQETALVLEVSDRTISNRLSQALSRLRQALGAASFAALLAGLESELGRCGAEPVPQGLCGRLLKLRATPTPRFPENVRRIAAVVTVAAVAFFAVVVAIRLRDSVQKRGTGLVADTESGGTGKTADAAGAGPSTPESRKTGKPAADPVRTPTTEQPAPELRDVVVHVANVGGQSMEGVGLRLEIDGSFRSGRSDASGRAFFRVPDVKATVQVLIADAESRRAYFVSRGTWDVPQGSAQVEVVVAEKSAVRGVAVDAEGTPLILSSVLTSIDGIPCGFDTTDGQGRFVAWVPEDRTAELVLTYSVKQKKGAPSFTHHVRVTGVRADSVDLRVAAPALEWDGRLVVHVVAPDGTPARGARVGIADSFGLTADTVRAGGAAPLDNFKATADDQGAVELANLPKVLLAVQAAPGGANPGAWLADGAVDVLPSGQTIVLRLRKSAEIKGVVLGPDGSPVADALVTASLDAATQPGCSSTRSGPDGRFVLFVDPGLSGPLVITGFRGESPSLIGTAEGILPGRQDVTIRLAPVE